MPEKELMKKVEEIKTEMSAAKEKAEVAEKRAKELGTELKAAQDTIAKSAETIKSQETQIDNLDKSIKAQNETIEKLRKMVKESPKGFNAMMRDALEEKREEIEKQLKGTGRFTVELKIATTDITAQTGAQYTGTVMDPTIHSVPVLSNAFLLAFGTKPLTGPRLGWVESTTSKNVGYVKELADNNNKTTVTFAEKYRKTAKVATYMEISSEFENWFENLYNYCIDEGQRVLLKDIDSKVWNGEGNDSTKQDEIYGIKSQSTAFAKLATYENATVADVILDSIAQINKAGYSANVALVSYGTEAQLQGLKDKDGNYIYDKVNSKLRQVTVIKTDVLTDSEILVADSSCAEIYMGNIYELEFSRQASTDSWRVDYRRHAQVKVTTPKKKGLIYVADIDTAITSITAAAASSVSES